MSSVLVQLVDPKIVKVFKLLLRNKNKIYHLSQISKDANVPIGTVFRIVPRLVRMNLVRQTLLGKTKLYQIDDNRYVRIFEDFITGGVV